MTKMNVRERLYAEPALFSSIFCFALRKAPGGARSLLAGDYEAGQDAVRALWRLVRDS